MRGAAFMPLLAAALLASSCGEEGEAMKREAGQRPASALPAEISSLAEAHVFFGHQSVGDNILDGIAALAREGGGKSLPIAEGEAPPSPSFRGILHARIGTNGDPQGKYRAFDALIRSGLGAWAHVALMKLCYADVNAGTDVDALFKSYVETMERLDADFPGVAFLHTTVPIATDEGGIKGLAKRLLGRDNRRDDNRARDRFNRMLRSAYGASGRLFDLALLETDDADSPPDQAENGARPPSLRPDFASDEGHLNEAGKRHVAMRFVAFLARFSGDARVGIGRP